MPLSEHVRRQLNSSILSKLDELQLSMHTATRVSNCKILKTKELKSDNYTSDNSSGCYAQHRIEVMTKKWCLLRSRLRCLDFFSCSRPEAFWLVLAMSENFPRSPREFPDVGPPATHKGPSASSILRCRTSKISQTMKNMATLFLASKKVKPKPGKSCLATSLALPPHALFYSSPSRPWPSSDATRHI